jgi:hypothetical protein
MGFIVSHVILSGAKDPGDIILLVCLKELPHVVHRLEGAARLR